MTVIPEDVPDNEVEWLITVKPGTVRGNEVEWLATVKAECAAQLEEKKTTGFRCTTANCRFYRSGKHKRELKAAQNPMNQGLLNYLHSKRQKVDVTNRPWCLYCLNCTCARVSCLEENVFPGKSYVKDFINFGPAMQGYFNQFFGHKNNDDTIHTL